MRNDDCILKSFRLQYIEDVVLILKYYDSVILQISVSKC